MRWAPTLDQRAARGGVRGFGRPGATDMSTLLIRNAHLLVTMDDQRREIADGAVFVRDNVIEAVGPSAAAAARPPTR